MADSNLDLGQGQNQNQNQDRDHLHLSTWDHLMQKYLRLYLSPKERTTIPASTRGPRATLAHRENRLGRRQLKVRYCIERI